MGKLSGYLLSSALIVICLWVNFCSFPDAIPQKPTSFAKSGAVDKSKEAANKTEAVESNVKESSKATVPQQKGTVQETQEPQAGITEVSMSANAPAYDLEDSELVGAVKIDKTSRAETKTSSKPQGGKYVSIPSQEVEPYRAFGAGDVFGVAQASVDAD